MTTHINDQIRAAIVTVLTGLDTTEDRVDEDILSVRAVAQPRLVIRVDTDSVDEGLQGLQQRDVSIMVTGYAKDSTGIAAILGAIQYEVEVAMAASGTLGGLVPGGVKLRSDERGIDTVQLEKPAGFIAMKFTGLCFTQASEPGMAQ